MSSEYSFSLIRDKIKELENTHDHSFICNNVDKEVNVSGMKVSRKQSGYAGGYQELLIEPRCSYYKGGYYKSGEGLSLSGGKCSISSNGYCSYCFREGIDTPGY